MVLSGSPSLRAITTKLPELNVTGSVKQNKGADHALLINFRHSSGLVSVTIDKEGEGGPERRNLWSG